MALSRPYAVARTATADRFPIPNLYKGQRRPLRPQRTIPARPEGRWPRVLPGPRAGFRTRGPGPSGVPGPRAHTGGRIYLAARRRARPVRPTTNTETLHTRRAGADVGGTPMAPRADMVLRQVWVLALAPPRRWECRCNTLCMHHNAGLGSQLGGLNSCRWPSNLPLMGVAYRCSLYRPRRWACFKAVTVGHPTRMLPKPAGNAKVRLRWASDPGRQQSGEGSCPRRNGQIVRCERYDAPNAKRLSRAPDATFE